MSMLFFFKIQITNLLLANSSSCLMSLFGMRVISSEQKKKKDVYFYDSASVNNFIVPQILKSVLARMRVFIC